MAVYLLPTVQHGPEACVAVQTAVYIRGTAYTSIYGESSLGHLQMYWLYMDSKWMNLAVIYIECQSAKILKKWILTSNSAVFKQQPTGLDPVWV